MQKKELTEQERIALMRKQKIRKDSHNLRKYAKRLKDERKTYQQTFEAYSVNQRKSREAALGACALKALDAVRELAGKKPLINGTLEYVINEQKVQDPDGVKGFHCSITFHVASDEQAWSDEDIRKEIEKTFEQFMRETDNLFPPEDEKHEKTEGKGDPVPDKV